MEGGFAANLRSVAPELPDKAWPSIYAGRNAAQTAKNHYIQLQPGTLKFRMLDANRGRAVLADRFAGGPPLRTHLEPREHDRVLYRRRNEVERLFRRLKGFRRIFSRFDKLDVMSSPSSTSPLSWKPCGSVNTP